MRVVTIQDKVILDNLLKVGKHETDQNLSNYKYYFETYDVMRTMMKNKLGYSLIPIWCLNKLHGDTPPLDLNSDRYGGVGCRIDENSVLLELEIEESKALVMNYYEWTDYMYYTEAKNEEAMKEALSYLYNLDEAYSIQVCIPHITIDMVKGVYRQDGKDEKVLKAMMQKLDKPLLWG